MLLATRICSPHPTVKPNRVCNTSMMGQKAFSCVKAPSHLLASYRCADVVTNFTATNRHQVLYLCAVELSVYFMQCLRWHFGIFYEVRRRERRWENTTMDAISYFPTVADLNSYPTIKMEIGGRKEETQQEKKVLLK